MAMAVVFLAAFLPWASMNAGGYIVRGVHSYFGVASQVSAIVGIVLSMIGPSLVIGDTSRTGIRSKVLMTFVAGIALVMICAAMHKEFKAMHNRVDIIRCAGFFVAIGAAALAGALGFIIDWAGDGNGRPSRKKSRIVPVIHSASGFKESPATRGIPAEAGGGIEESSADVATVTHAEMDINKVSYAEFAARRAFHAAEADERQLVAILEQRLDEQQLIRILKEHLRVLRDAMGSHSLDPNEYQRKLANLKKALVTAINADLSESDYPALSSRRPRLSFRLTFRSMLYSLRGRNRALEDASAVPASEP